MTERKDLIQDIESAEAQDLLAIAQDVKTEGYRLCQICATVVGDSLEVLYTFEQDNILKNFKFTVGAEEPELQSVTAVFSYAFVYENELHDLFGITFKNLALDYGGNFFRIAEATPWNPAAAKGGEN